MLKRKRKHSNTKRKRKKLYDDKDIDLDKVRRFLHRTEFKMDEDKSKRYQFFIKTTFDKNLISRSLGVNIPSGCEKLFLKLLKEYTSSLISECLLCEHGLTPYNLLTVIRNRINLNGDFLLC